MVLAKMSKQGVSEALLDAARSLYAPFPYLEAFGLAWPQSYEPTLMGAPTMADGLESSLANQTPAPQPPAARPIQPPAPEILAVQAEQIGGQPVSASKPPASPAKEVQGMTGQSKEMSDKVAYGYWRVNTGDHTGAIEHFTKMLVVLQSTDRQGIPDTCACLSWPRLCAGACWPTQGSSQ